MLLIDKDGNNCGIVPRDEAIRIAKSFSLDLVVISRGQSYPVCNIVDYGKFKYEQSRKKAKQSSNKFSMKEIKVRPVIEENDYQVKMKASRSFLEAGNQVKVIMQFRGREIVFKDRGMEVLNRICSDLSDCSKVDRVPKIEGKQAVLILSCKGKN